MFPSSGEGKETPTLLDLLTRADVSYPNFYGTQQNMCLHPSPEDSNISSLQTLCLLLISYL
jgi:hypothetical protein